MKSVKMRIQQMYKKILKTIKLKRLIIKSMAKRDLKFERTFLYFSSNVYIYVFF